VLELARCEFLQRRENVLLRGNSGTGRTHVFLALGLAACQRGHRVRFIAAYPCKMFFGDTDRIRDGTDELWPPSQSASFRAAQLAKRRFGQDAP
jgi:chromosomal replication initiation ATPase DnaA